LRLKINVTTGKTKDADNECDVDDDVNGLEIFEIDEVQFAKKYQNKEKNEKQKQLLFERKKSVELIQSIEF
jgi:hypothetical protein